LFLVVGLGNPGREHEGNRHNVGFLVVDALRRAEGWPDFKAEQKFSGACARGSLSGASVILLEPQTYMNRSGDSVQAAVAFWNVPPENLIVVHDELDLAWGQVRLKEGGGHAGHNGVRSVIDRLGSPDFVRVRVGIGRPPSGVATVTEWVLSSFDALELAELPRVVDAAVTAVRGVVTTGTSVATKE
jgi:peptidyl-tRNA hydrolase, PTH1 family